VRRDGAKRMIECGAALDAQIRQLNSTVHICGHTHTTIDKVIDNVRYIQNAVRYPKERLPNSVSIKKIR